MWETIKSSFKNYPAQMKVAKTMLDLGLHLGEDNKIYCGNLKITDQHLGEAADVDRRVVKATINTISNDEYLYGIFKNIIPAGTLLKNIAKNFSLGVIEIETNKENYGILAEATRIMYSNEVNIRQAYANDQDMNELPVLTLITDLKVSNEVLNELLAINGVTKVSVY
ncbi:MAG: amino acid-binding protein [Methanobrevibacter sp.]|jgi:predicted regulator of amino acid metabolism with ACT domain|nr:amino acid-binding protein [Candidatus Methanoflexus mossambicus]